MKLLLRFYIVLHTLRQFALLTFIHAIYSKSKLTRNRWDFRSAIVMPIVPCFNYLLKGDLGSPHFVRRWWCPNKQEYCRLVGSRIGKRPPSLPFHHCQLLSICRCISNVFFNYYATTHYSLTLGSSYRIHISDWNECQTKSKESNNQLFSHFPHKLTSYIHIKCKWKWKFLTFTNRTNTPHCARL